MIWQGRTRYGGWALDLAPWRDRCTARPPLVAWAFCQGPRSFRRRRIRGRIGRIAIRLGRWRLDLEIC